MAKKTPQERAKIKESARVASDAVAGSEYDKTVVYHAMLIINGIRAAEPRININSKPKPKPIAEHLTAREFNSSIGWKKARFEVLDHYAGECMLCGRSKKMHGIVVSVDHIKPRSTHPELALKFDNLQVFCEDCNQGKGAEESKDYRPVNLTNGE